MLESIVTMIARRPYVFAFLITYLVLGRIYFGQWRKTLVWLVLGYVIAWASEASSIRNGFPYGWYFYKYENMPGEPMVWGVPFWDSLSYPFMIFAGWTTAKFILGRSLRGNSRSNPPDTSDTRRLPRHFVARNDMGAALLGSALTLLLDIIIDPLTVRGTQWFLGDIYYYPGGGAYFGVPFSNFAGWFIVPLVVILLFSVIARSETTKQSPVQDIASSPSETRNDRKLAQFLNPLFYLAIALFNIFITAWIGEYLIVAIDCLYLIPVVGLIIWRTKQLTRSRT